MGTRPARSVGAEASDLDGRRLGSRAVVTATPRHERRRRTPAARSRRSPSGAWLVTLVALASACEAAGCAASEPSASSTTDSPDLATTTTDAARESSRGAMAVTAHPLATDAALKILRSGGTAADAAIAAQLVLGLVEPQSSGLGGGACVVFYDASTGSVTTLDARETAPAAATERYLLAEDGEPLGFFSAVRSGRSVGVPGVPRLLEVMHEEHGKRPWKSLFEPALELARHGFPISPVLHHTIVSWMDTIRRDASARAYLLDSKGAAKPAGAILHNPDYAETLDTLARRGADGFYRGAIADDVAKAVRSDPGGSGVMTASDLAGYRVVPRPPVCGSYRGNEVCGMGPPSSGGVAVTQMLGMLERFDMRAAGPSSLRSVHLFTQAGRLAFADRATYLADSDFVTVPVSGLVDRGYVASRAALIDEERDMGTAHAGSPHGETTGHAPDPSPPIASGTSHLSIRDTNGNAVAMTTTIEAPFGNGRMTHGFFLNNELTDFSFAPSVDHLPVANRVEGGKRPRSSMSPTIVRDVHGKLSIVTGSPGGANIIHTTTQSVVAIVDWQLAPHAAVALPHYRNSNDTTTLERFAPGIIGPDDVTRLAPELRAMGHTVTVGTIPSGLSTIQLTEHGLLGGADPRGEGTVGGFDPLQTARRAAE